MSAIYSFNCWTSATNGWKIAYENSSTEPRSAARACVLLLDVHALRATCAGTVWAGCLFVWMTPAAILDCVSSVMTVCCCYPLWCSGSYIWRGVWGGGVLARISIAVCVCLCGTLWQTGELSMVLEEYWAVEEEWLNGCLHVTAAQTAALTRL